MFNAVGNYRNNDIGIKRFMNEIGLCTKLSYHQSRQRGQYNLRRE